MPDPTAITAVAAACMARGLNQEQAQKVWEELYSTRMPHNFYGVWSRLNDAIDRQTEAAA